MRQFLFRFICICFVLYCAHSSGWTQSVFTIPKIEQWKAKTITQANTVKYAGYLSYEERMVLFYTNLARLNGKLFSKTFLQLYIDSLNLSGPELRSLQKSLRFSRKKIPLKPQKDLTQISKSKAISVGKTGKVEQAVADENRYLKLMRKYKAVGEGSVYSYSKPLDIVIYTLLDIGNEKATNRANMMNKYFNTIGISIKPHSSQEFVCVQSYAESKAYKQSWFKRFFY